MMGELINFCFNSGDKRIVGVTRYGAIWTNSREKHIFSFDQISSKLPINCLLDNACLTLGSMCFR